MSEAYFSLMQRATNYKLAKFKKGLNHRIRQAPLYVIVQRLLVVQNTFQALVDLPQMQLDEARARGQKSMNRLQRSEKVGAAVGHESHRTMGCRGQSLA